MSPPASPSCRLLIDAAADGAWNMAADDTLLDSAAAGVATLRFYAWAEPTLSLGYFQAHRPARAFPGLRPLPWVRRPSGGDAIVHHHELTYSLALPPGPVWQPAGLAWMPRLHELLGAALATLGVRAELCAAPCRLGEVLCFLHHTPGDLVVAGHKVVGSAQRRQRGALLQHGSVLLRRSPFAPALPGLADLSGRPLTPDAVRPALLELLPGALGWELTAGDYSAAERAAVPDRVATRFAAAGWNEKR